MPSTAFVDPAALSASSPSSSCDESSPPPQSAPSRKRARSDMSAEDRREARAHRNRIAAQNSRDRRKIQFASLNARVSELEEENRQLKEELSKYRSQQQPSPQIIPTVSTLTAFSSAPVLIASQFTDTSRERENEELRERVRSLEKSWESVVRTLAAQGKHDPAVALPSPPASSSGSSASPLLTLASPTLSLLSSDANHDELTRHSARVATAGTPSLVSSASLQRVTPTLRLARRAPSTPSPPPSSPSTQTTTTRRPSRSSLPPASKTGSWTSSRPRPRTRPSPRSRLATTLLLSLALRKAQLRRRQSRQ